MLWAFLVLVAVGILIISLYNKLVAGRQQVQESWSNIDTQLKRRYDLIPNLIESVKGYAKHEKGTLEAVIEARNTASGIKGHGEDKAAAENMLSGALKSLFAITEAYPDLKANQNFMQLQQELTDTENKLQAARSFYNATVLSQNTRIETFPSNLIAARFGFKAESFFELDDDEKAAVKKAPKVSF